MRHQSLVLALILLAATAYAKELKAYQSGELLQMESVPCVADEKDSGHKTPPLMCQEYVLQAEQVIYRIRPQDAKHVVLLPVGQRAQFRLENGKMLVRVEELNNKEHQYLVISMKPRGDRSADARPVRLNHLQ